MAREPAYDFGLGSDGGLRGSVTCLMEYITRKPLLRICCLTLADLGFLGGSVLYLVYVNHQQWQKGLPP